MNDLLELIIFILFVTGGGSALTGAWLCRNRKKKTDVDEQPRR